MVNSIGSLNVAPSVQAVNKARENAQAQRGDQSRDADEISVSREAQELLEAERLAAEAREALTQNSDESLTRLGQGVDQLL